MVTLMRLTASIACVLMLSSASNADTLFKVSLVANVAAHGADLASTEHCLGSGRCREMNPWLARFENPATFGAVKMGIAGVSMWASDEIRKRNRWAGIAFNFASASAFAYIAARNTRVAR